MDPAHFTTLPSLLSAERFGTYLRAVGGDRDRALRLYTWNIEVSAAMWGPLQAFEVVYRNCCDAELSEHHNTPLWWNTPGLSFTEDQKLQLKRAAFKNDRSESPSPKAIVAELSFGFWAALLRPQTEQQFWVPTLRRVFTHYHGSRARLFREINGLRLLRNRIAHHEPIFARHLLADHRKILRLGGYLSQELEAWMAGGSRVPACLAARNERLRSGKESSF